MWVSKTFWGNVGGLKALHLQTIISEMLQEYARDCFSFFLYNWWEDKLGRQLWREDWLPLLYKFGQVLLLAPAQAPLMLKAPEDCTETRALVSVRPLCFLYSCYNAELSWDYNPPRTFC